MTGSIETDALLGKMRAVSDHACRLDGDPYMIVRHGGCLRPGPLVLGNSEKVSRYLSAWRVDGLLPDLVESRAKGA